MFRGGKCLLRISGGWDNIVVTAAGIRIDGNYKQTNWFFSPAGEFIKRNCWILYLILIWGSFEVFLLKGRGKDFRIMKLLICSMQPLKALTIDYPVQHGRFINPNISEVYANHCLNFFLEFHGWTFLYWIIYIEFVISCYQCCFYSPLRNTILVAETLLIIWMEL